MTAETKGMKGARVSKIDPAVILSSDGRKLGRAHQASGADPVAVARLWAAAPALYAELKYLVEWIEANGRRIELECSEDELLRDARAALTQARGGGE